MTIRWFGYGAHFWRQLAGDSHRAISSAGERKDFTEDEWLQIQDFDATLDNRFDARFPDIVTACTIWENEDKEEENDADEED